MVIPAWRSPSVRCSMRSGWTQRLKKRGTKSAASGLTVSKSSIALCASFVSPSWPYAAAMMTDRLQSGAALPVAVVGDKGAEKRTGESVERIEFDGSLGSEAKCRTISQEKLH